MAAEVRIYDCTEVTANFVGIPIDNGLGEDEFIRIEQQEEDYSIHVGADGTLTRASNNNVYTLVTVTLGQSSPVNNALSALRLLGQHTKGGADVGPLIIKDRQGTSLHFASKAWIQAPPKKAYGKKAGQVEWVLGCLMDERLDGGN